ncbi:MAG: integrase, partial [Propionibacteriaceae bacterium]|nr:integrase [Propionibacteriaceae bacterium]
MRSRAEVTKRYATEYAKAPKHVKSQILDEVCRVTDWSRDNARRRLAQKASGPPGRRRRPGPATGSRR